MEAFGPALRAPAGRHERCVDGEACRLVVGEDGEQPESRVAAGRSTAGVARRSRHFRLDVVGERGGEQFFPRERPHGIPGISGGSATAPASSACTTCSSCLSARRHSSWTRRWRLPGSATRSTRRSTSPRTPTVVPPDGRPTGSRPRKPSPATCSVPSTRGRGVSRIGRLRPWAEKHGGRTQRRAACHARRFASKGTPAFAGLVEGSATHAFFRCSGSVFTTCRW